MNHHPPSSSSSSKPTAAWPPPPPPPILSRYGSAPGSLLRSLAEASAGDFHPAAAAGSSAVLGRFFPGEASSLTSDSSCKPTAAPDLGHFRTGAGGGGGGGGGDPLVRHSSSPAGFFSHLLVDNGFGVARDSGAEGVHGLPPTRRLKSQLSFTRQSALSHISEDGGMPPEIGESIGGSHSDETGGNAGGSRFSIGSWDDTNSLFFSPHATKPSNKDYYVDSQQFDLPRTSMEMATADKFLQIQQDHNVPFKIRAKRGCATHPRSIAERERRTRISEKLRKLQELVPNMDKQTSTADMLDLAVQHIKGLQSQLQILTQETENCTCGSKQEKN